MYNIRELNSDNAMEMPLALDAIELSNPFIIDINLKWVQPFGMLVASKAIKEFRNAHPDIDFQLRYNDNSSAFSYAGHMGFFKSISESLDIGKMPGEALGNSRYIPITKINLTEIHKKEIDSGHFIAMGDAIENEATRLANVLSNGNIELRKLLTYLIREILRNIPEHSESNDAWICGQSWADGSAEIAIVDNGIGIKDSLQKNIVHSQYIHSDEDALQCALKAGISKAFRPDRGNSSDDVWSNSGFGLYMVSQICATLNGSFNIISGNKYIKINSKYEFEIGESQFNGTGIKIYFNTRNTIKADEIIRKVAKKGENQAKSIKNAFKKASTPSKGLMDNV